MNSATPSLMIDWVRDGDRRCGRRRNGLLSRFWSRDELAEFCSAVRTELGSKLNLGSTLWTFASYLHRVSAVDAELRISWV